MGKRLIVFSLIVFLEFLFAAPTNAADFRVLKLTKFLADNGSPLVYFAKDFVSQADANGLDYRLLVSISGVESTFGRHYLPGTFNAYGWGAGEITFSSWQAGIEKVSTSLRTNYINRGANDLSQIARIYCPPNSDKWATRVQYFMDKIESGEGLSYTLQKLPLTI